MYKWKKFFPVAILLIARNGHAEQVGILEHQRGWMKVENGLILSWIVNSEDGSSKQVEVFNKQGKSLASFNILRLVEGAKRVSIYDVSGRPEQMITVAAVYSKEDGSWPAGALLYFDPGGKLLSALHSLHRERFCGLLLMST